MPGPWLADLGVLQEGGLAVHAAPTAVVEGISMLGPAALQSRLVPGLVNTQDGGVYEATDIHPSEVFTPVIECHPEGNKENQFIGSRFKYTGKTYSMYLKRGDYLLRDTSTIAE